MDCFHFPKNITCLKIQNCNILDSNDIIKILQSNQHIEKLYLYCYKSILKKLLEYLKNCGNTCEIINNFK